MRRTALLAPLLLASCSMFSSDEPPRPPEADVAAIVASAVDESQAKSDAQIKDVRAELVDVTQSVERLRNDLGDARTRAQDDAVAAVAAETAAAQSQRQLVLTGAVATLALLSTLVLAVVVVWQTVLLRRAQRQLGEAEARAAQAVERAAMAATLAGAPPLPGDESPVASAPPQSAAAAGARLRAAR